MGLSGGRDDGPGSTAADKYRADPGALSAGGAAGRGPSENRFDLFPHASVDPLFGASSLSSLKFTSLRALFPGPAAAQLRAQELPAASCFSPLFVRSSGCRSEWRGWRLRGALPNRGAEISRSGARRRIIQICL